MSSDRLPKESRNILLTMYYRDGFCTIQAMWDNVEIERLRKAGHCKLVAESPPHSIYVRKSRGSQALPRDLAMNIIGRWLKGEYVKVQYPLFPETEALDWMS
jgi:hypothetical protein